MTKPIPETIFLQWYGDDWIPFDEDDPSEVMAPSPEVTWCEDEIFNTDVVYVRADTHEAALERIKELESANTEFAAETLRLKAELFKLGKELELLQAAEVINE